jgi:hypothetical protein
MKYNNNIILVFYLILGGVIGFLILRKNAEPFINPPPMDSEMGLRYFQSLFGQIKRVGGFLLNKNTWSYGMSLHNKSPVELARMQIELEQQQKSRN